MSAEGAMAGPAVQKWGTTDLAKIAYNLIDKTSLVRFDMGEIIEKQTVMASGQGFHFANRESNIGGLIKMQKMM